MKLLFTDPLRLMRINLYMTVLLKDSIRYTKINDR
nr:MAG TPA: RNA polymerase I subunit [Caudoviricetes sp.]